MGIFHLVAVCTVGVVLTSASPTPEESIFSDLSDLSDLSSDVYNPDSAADLSPPLGDLTLFDGSNDGTSLFTPDLIIADDFCSAPNGPARKRDTNLKCGTSPLNNPSINSLQLPSLLDLENSLGPQNSQTGDNGDITLPLPDPFKALPVDDSVTSKLRKDDGKCLEYPYLENLCCNGPWFARVPGIVGTIYTEIRACYYSELPILIFFFFSHHELCKSLTMTDRCTTVFRLSNPYPCLLYRI